MSPSPPGHSLRGAASQQGHGLGGSSGGSGGPVGTATSTPASSPSSSTVRRWQGRAEDAQARL